MLVSVYRKDLLTFQRNLVTSKITNTTLYNKRLHFILNINEAFFMKISNFNNLLIFN